MPENRALGARLILRHCANVHFVVAVHLCVFSVGYGMWWDFFCDLRS